MNHTRFLVSIIATLLPVPLFGQAASSSASETLKQVGITVDYFQLDHTEANQRVRAHLSTGLSDATALHSTLTELTEAGKAQWISGGYIVTRSGQRAKLESIVEHIYPVSFDPPKVPQELSGPIEDGAQIKTPLTATAFSTRNTGMTLEVDPVIGADGATVDLNIATEIVELVGYKPWGQKESRLSQPVFNTMKNSTAVTSEGGKWVFIGTHRPSPSLDALSGTSDTAANERIIALARIDILKTRLDSGNPSRSQSAPAIISTMAEYFEVDSANAMKLLARHSQTGSGMALRDELDALSETKGTRLLETKSLTTRSGQRAKTESVSEWIYPTKMDSPTAPQKLTGPIAEGADVITSVAFTAFETRNIGTTLEIDPVANISNGGKLIDINVAPEMITLLGETTHGQANAQFSSPVFASLKTSTAATVRSNDPLLASVYMPVNRETRKLDSTKRIFLFLTASTLQVD